MLSIKPDKDLPLPSTPESRLKTRKSSLLSYLFKHILNSLYLDYKGIDTKPSLQNRRQRKNVRENKLRFYDKCHDLIGQWVFLQTLLTSPQNSLCRADAPSNPGVKDYSVIARNLANIKDGTEALRNKVRHHHDDENLHAANRATRLSLRLAWLSLVLGLLRILLALLSFQCFI